MSWFCNENRFKNILVPIVNVLSIYWDLFTGLDQLQSADFIFW